MGRESMFLLRSCFLQISQADIVYSNPNCFNELNFLSFHIVEYVKVYELGMTLFVFCANIVIPTQEGTAR
jgi:hypothetical protein